MTAAPDQGRRQRGSVANSITRGGNSGESLRFTATRPGHRSFLRFAARSALLILRQEQQLLHAETEFVAGVGLRRMQHLVDN